MNHSPDNWKEARRLQAWHLKQKGWSQRQIAEAMGVSEAAISQWMRRAHEGGLEALRHRSPPGAPRRLSAVQLARLPELLHRGPEAYGFRGQLWTRGRIAAVIQLEFGVSYHPRHVGRLCQVMRWSPQKPARRARQLSVSPPDMARSSSQQKGPGRRLRGRSEAWCHRGMPIGGQGLVAVSASVTTRDGTRCGTRVDGPV